MFILPPCPSEGDLTRKSRRPCDWWHLVSEGWTFLPENRRWDADEREWISRASGLHQLSPSESTNARRDKWWKAFARKYVQNGSLYVALVHASGECDGNE